jgi:hydroxypyruvate isomerase
MPDFTANLSTMFTELPFMQRFDAAARCGFSGVEFACPEAVAEKELARRLRECELTLVAFNLPAGKWEHGERGIACDPARIQEFREGARRAIDYAAAVGCRFLNCLAGSLSSGGSIAGSSGGDNATATASQTLLENLRFAAGPALAAGITILVEPVDTCTLPGSYLHGTAQTVSLLDAVAARNVALLYDVFQMHAMGEPVGPTIARHLARIGHIQIAGWPDRSEPIAGEIEYKQLLGFIDRIGYRGWVGCEYFPRAGTEAGLGWMSRYKALTSRHACRWGIPVQALPPSMSAVALS